MKQLLYLEDSYLSSFETVVKSVNIDEGYIILQQTAFHPQGGHQEPDTGTIQNGSGNWEVSSVKSVKGSVLHYVSNKEGLKDIFVGSSVQGKINWERRYKLMKTHTAQHLISAVAKKMFGLESVDMNIAAGEGSIKFNRPIKTEQAVEIQEEANKLIKKDLAVTRINNEGIYTVHIDGYDSRECGCTHIKRLNEAGQVYIYAVDENRIFFCTDDIAQARATKDQTGLLILQGQYKQSIQTIADSYEKIQLAYRDTEKQISVLAAELLMHELTRKSNAYQSIIENLIVVKRPELDIKTVSLIVREFLNILQKTVIVIGKNNTALVFSNQTTITATKVVQIFKYNSEAYKGGGNDSFSQGGPWTKDVQETYDIVESAILEVTAFCD